MKSMGDLLFSIIEKGRAVKNGGKKVAGSMGAGGLGFLLWWVNAQITEVKASVESARMMNTQGVALLSGIKVALENQTKETDRLRKTLIILDNKLDSVKIDVEVMKAHHK